MCGKCRWNCPLSILPLRCNNWLRVTSECYYCDGVKLALVDRLSDIPACSFNKMEISTLLMLSLRECGTILSCCIGVVQTRRTSVSCLPRSRTRYFSWISRSTTSCDDLCLVLRRLRRWFTGICEDCSFQVVTTRSSQPGCRDRFADQRVLANRWSPLTGNWLSIFAVSRFHAEALSRRPF